MIIVPSGSDVVVRAGGDEADASDSPLAFFIFLLIILFVMFSGGGKGGAGSGGGGGGGGAGGDRVAVVRLQVGLLGLARGIQADLDALAAQADTSSAAGLHGVLQEAVLSLLRNPQYCIYGAGGLPPRSLAALRSRAAMPCVRADARCFSPPAAAHASDRTVAGVGGASAADADADADAEEGRNEYIVVTLLVAADAPLALPPVRSLEQLQAALRRLGAVAPEAVQAVEVVWSPQAAGDALTQEDLARGYPQLQAL